MNHRVRRGLLTALGLLLSAACSAQVGEVQPFSGTLQKIHESGVIRVGHRENSPPFAFLDAQRRPIGYSLDLCAEVVEQVAQRLHKPIRVEFVPVSPSDRFDKIRDGRIDIECGSTTASAERRGSFDFSPTIFVTGTKLLVKRGAGIRSLRDLNGRTVVLTRGTVHADAVPKLAGRRGLDIRFVDAADHDQSYGMLSSGAADAFANDDVQLHGMVAARNAESDYRVVGELLTYADYALMLRREDTEFAGVVREAFDRIGQSGAIRAIYRKWFLRPLPTGISLDLPMSAHLEHVFGVNGNDAD